MKGNYICTKNNKFVCHKQKNLITGNRKLIALQLRSLGKN